ncbi:MAG: calcium/sodium antiporter [Eubacteriales bacterium]
METFIIVALFILGVALTIKGGDYFIDAASWISEALNIPKFIVGATIVSVATTLPELIVSVLAATEGKVDMAVGNAVGSVTVNVGLVMGISILCMPIAIKRSKFAFKGILMILSCALLFLFSYNGQLGIMPSVLLLAMFCVFVIENIKDSKRSMLLNIEKKKKFENKEAFVNILKFIFGVLGIVIGARLLVDNGSEIARLLNVPESIIGATVIAIGTSLPELVTTIAALAKKHATLSIGNIVGANIIDLTVILPVCTLISGKALPISNQAASLDLPVCLGVILIATLPTLMTQKFKRYQGVLIIFAYLIYLTVLCA